MKKIFAFTFAIGTFNSFSFMKMEGPLGVKPEPFSYHMSLHEKGKYIYQVNKDENLFKEVESKIKTKYAYLIFYNRQTGYMITINMAVYDDPSLEASDNITVGNLISEFFQGNKIQDHILKSQFIIVKEEKEVCFTDFCDEDWCRTNLDTCYRQIERWPYCLKDQSLWRSITDEDILNLRTQYHITDFKLQPVITISNITICNQDDQITISKAQSKPTNFYEVLCDYYNNKKHYDAPLKTIKNLKNNNQSNIIIEQEIGEHEVVEKLKENRDSYNLLKKSTILRVDAVLKGDEGKNSIICGLAEDNDTKEKFFWITDLKKDISTLLN